MWHYFYVSWLIESIVIRNSWEALTLALGPLHKRTVNKLEGFLLLRFKQLNRLLFLNSGMITKIKWKATISEGKRLSLSWTPSWSRHAFSSSCSICAAPGDAFHNQSDESFEMSELGCPMSQEPQTIHSENYNWSLSVECSLFSPTKTT